MRSRAALAATAVVAVALVAAGLTVLLTLRGSLTRQSDLQAEIIAREVAAQVAVGTPVTRLDLPDSEDHPVQVVDEHGRVLAVTRDLNAISGTGSRSVTPSGARTGEGDDHGRDDDPRRGEVSTDVRYSGGRATVDHDAADYRFAAVEATPPAGGTVVVYAGARLATQAVGSVTRAMLLGLPLLLLVVGGVTWLVTRRALRPVEAIRAEMAAITSAGDLARRVPVPGSRDEVAGLAETTNQTLGALERSVERQRRFVADASHELRSPLASLRTQLEVAAAHPHLLDVDGAVQDVVRLQDLAAGLLLLARLDAGERPRHDRVDLGELVREEVAHRAATGRVPVEVTGTGAFEVLGSAAQLERVLVNLLDNAQRHAASAVRVELAAGGGRVTLRVADDGPGVPPADRERIFERFVRLDDARARDEGGAGLGLAIARGVVRAHGGELTAGGAPGGGAAFELWLPAL
ncbi:sensor histidine kinase [Actinomadura verrucosospora]|uniref:histidine kinase n=1 Tax=Actinomadura verrucosospora TaxID=46165 RepID=A0A7D3ZI23_ACTVE|nr:HAMP domain-containing sensor histidine kinase [Actinomadura verrucosospora]QKG24377.1 Two-component sensor histidine kinase [Actinomadura verrucosospora]